MIWKRYSHRHIGTRTDGTKVAVCQSGDRWIIYRDIKRNDAGQLTGVRVTWRPTLADAKIRAESAYMMDLTGVDDKYKGLTV